MRTVFMGTPELAVPTLEALLQKGHEVASVITQPDRPAGRGRKLRSSPVKSKALALGLPVEQPARIKAPEALERLQQRDPEAIVVVGYGQILPQSILDLPRLGCVNVHASLLPKYRGAAPINWAIANGDTVTGVTTMCIERRLDAGDILLKRQVEIGPMETAPELAERLARMGADLLVETLAGLERGTLVGEKQDETEATYAPMLKREDGWIDWNLTAGEIFSRIRGFAPWPGSYTSFRGKRLHVRKAHQKLGASAAPGAISMADGSFEVGCGGGTALVLEELQLEGKKQMPAAEFARGYRISPNEVLGEALQ